MVRKVASFVVTLIIFDTGSAMAGTPQLHEPPGTTQFTTDSRALPAPGKEKAVSGEKERAIQASFLSPLPSFIKNGGQRDRTIIFYEQGRGHATIFTREDISPGPAKPGNTKGEKKTPDIVTLAPRNASSFAVEGLDIMLPPKKKGTTVALTVPFGRKRGGERRKKAPSAHQTAGV